MIIYATGLICNSAAIFFTNGKKSGMLERLGTMPVERKSIFMGGSLSGNYFSRIIQILIMFILGYGLMQVYFKDFSLMLVGFFIAIQFAIQSAGIGLIISAFSKPGCSKWICIDVFYASHFLIGILIRLESDIVYFFRLIGPSKFDCRLQFR